MPYSTGVPRVLKRANQWQIGHVAIDPEIPSMTWTMRVYFNEEEVDRVTLTLAGDDLRSTPGFKQTFKALRKMMNDYAITVDVIPPTATEDPDPPDPPPPPPPPPPDPPIELPVLP